MTLAPAAKGQANINISKASVKRYGDAVEILSSAGNGSYILTGVVNADPERQSTSQPGLYTLNLKVTATKTAVPNATITLTTVSSKNKQQASTGNTGTVHFSNLQTGVYDASVTRGNNKIGETIVNVSGPNHVLTLGIDIDTQKNNPLMKTGSLIASLVANPLFLIVTLIVGIILGVGIALLIIKLLSKKKH
jgi:hypothetical protein